MIIAINEKEFLKYASNAYYTPLRRDREDVYKAIKSTMDERNSILLIKYTCEQMNYNPDRDW